MNTIVKDTYILLNSEEKNFADFMAEFKKKYTEFNKTNLIINFSDDLSLNSEEILLLLPYSEKFQKNGISFVLVISDIDVDAFPESLNIVPTLNEAEDVVEMEEIQRDLGF